VRIFSSFLVLVTFLLAGCSLNVSEYSDMKPTFTLEDYFQGRLMAHGVVKNRSGKVIRYFNATIDASWDANGVGTLDEHFVFNDGEKQQRVWTLKPDGTRQHSGTAGDVIGAADINAAGNAVFLSYVLRIPYNDDTLDITVDDRMYRVSDSIVLNESRLLKLGIEVGSILLVIERGPAQ
jgi:hypothetical protein